jgi:hypothetical protein
MMDYGLITFFVILGAAGLVVMGFVVARFYNKDDINGMKDPSNEQVEYMRSVRHRYFDALEWTARLVERLLNNSLTLNSCRQGRKDNHYNQRPSSAV